MTNILHTNGKKMSRNQAKLANWQKKKPELTPDQKKVLEALEEIGPATCEEVANHLGVPPHTISGRFGGEGELAEQGEIESDGQKQNPRGYMVTIWKVKQ